MRLDEQVPNTIKWYSKTKGQEYRMPRNFYSHDLSLATLAQMRYLMLLLLAGCASTNPFPIELEAGPTDAGIQDSRDEPEPVPTPQAREAGTRTPYANWLSVCDKGFECIPKTMRAMALDAGVVTVIDAESCKKFFNPDQTPMTLDLHACIQSISRLTCPNFKIIFKTKKGKLCT